MNITKV